MGPAARRGRRQLHQVLSELGPGGGHQRLSLEAGGLDDGDGPAAGLVDRGVTTMAVRRHLVVEGAPLRLALGEAVGGAGHRALGRDGALLGVPSAQRQRGQLAAGSPHRRIEVLTAGKLRARQLCRHLTPPRGPVGATRPHRLNRHRVGHRSCRGDGSAESTTEP